MENKNRGEWSELYVFFRLLCEGKLYSADENMKKRFTSYLEVLKILREDIAGIRNDYKRNNDKVEIYLNDVKAGEVDAQIFKEEADYLFDRIKLGKSDDTTTRKKGAFEIHRTEKFMNSIAVYKVKDSGHKADIVIELLDSHNGFATETGFSIKTNYKSAPATPVNASEATNFVYRLKGNFNDNMMNDFNSINTSAKIKDKMRYLVDNNIELEFVDTYREQTKINLRRIDSLLPDIVSELLKIHFMHEVSTLKECLDILTQNDPFDYKDDLAYTYKVRKFLVACCLGLDLGKRWNGDEEATGGIIYVEEDGDIIVYHLYDRNTFEKALINNTKFEHSSTSRHKYAAIEKNGDEYFIKLNLQIRYK